MIRNTVKTWLTAVGILLAIVIVSAIALDNDASTEQFTPKAEHKHTAPAAPAPSNDEPADNSDTDKPAMSKHDLTKMSFDAVWNSSTETDKDTRCLGLALYGPDDSADLMQQGADGSTDLDWDYMARLMQDECDQR